MTKNSRKFQKLQNFIISGILIGSVKTQRLAGENLHLILIGWRTVIGWFKSLVEILTAVKIAVKGGKKLSWHL